jgi:hypothetical protein
MNHFEVTGSAYALACGERDEPVKWTIGQVVGMFILGAATSASVRDETERRSLQGLPPGGRRPQSVWVARLSVAVTSVPAS